MAIGNSLTLITSWGRGICSTKPDNDYFGLIVAYLLNNPTTSINKNVVAHRWNFAIWERSSNRTATLDLLDPFLNTSLDLVTIQLGENVHDTSTYETDLEILIDYVQAKAPKAQVILIDDFWDDIKSEMRKRVALKKNLMFADLSAIRRNKKYQSRAGTECFMEDGRIKKVSKEAETHPNDEGMKFIAEKVIKVIN